MNKSNYISYPAIPTSPTNPIYDKIFKDSISDSPTFWDKTARELIWSKPYSTILDTSHPHLHRWFPDGEINMCYNCIDRHVDEGNGQREAFSYVGAYTGVNNSYTFSQVQVEVGKLASLMTEQFGVGVGDRVVIYMPMIP
jgi:propionyl-CoA synthetase